MKLAATTIAVIVVCLLIWGGVKYHNRTLMAAEERREAPEPVLQKQSIPKLRELVEHFEDGSRKAVRHVIDANPQIREGGSLEYYRNGKLRSEMNYSENVPSGRFWLYNEYGSLAMEGILKGGQRDGRFTEWHPDGRVKIECGYKNGVLDGAWTEYYDADGSPKKIESHYRDGAPTGRYAVYKIDGLVKEEKVFGHVPAQAGDAQGDEAKTPPHDCSDTPISENSQTKPKTP